MFNQLLKIKEHREQSAANKVRLQRQVVTTQQHKVETAKEDARQFHQERLNREVSLFAEIKGKAVSLKDLEVMQAKVASLRQQEAQKQQQIVEEQHQLETDEQQLEQRVIHHSDALKGREKFKEIVAMEQEKKAADDLKRAEDEIEEIASARWQPKQ